MNKIIYDFNFCNIQMFELANFLIVTLGNKVDWYEIQTSFFLNGAVGFVVM